MKQEWKYGILGDVVKKGSSNISLNKLKDEEGDYPVFGAKGFIKNVSFFQQEHEYLAIIKDGAGIGRVSKYPEKSSVLATMQYLIPKNGFDIDFIQYFLKGIDFEKHRSGSTIPHIYFKNYKTEPFPLTPLPEQQRIVFVLDEAFASIAGAKSNAERNLVNARELFETVLEKIFITSGKGWVIKKIGDVCNLYQGLAINKGTKHLLVPESNLPLLRIKDLRNNSAEMFVKESGYPKNSLVKETDILYSRTGASLGLVFTGRRGILHNNSFKITPNSMLDREYLFWWLQNPIFKKKIFGLASKTAQPDITHKIFKQQEIMIPPLAEQRAIVERLEALSAETGRLEEIYAAKVHSLEELRRVLLGKAFSGEL